MLQGLGYITLDNGQLHYLQAGTGSKLLICFHGYGNDASMFTDLEALIGAEYTIVSIDLPHHGSSEWPDELPLHRQDLVRLVKELLQRYNVQEACLLGYSIGGRVCLSVMQQLPQLIEKAILVAPDGMTFNSLYSFVTRTAIGKRLFKDFLHDPVPYVRVLHWLKKRKWLNASRYKFVAQYLESKERRAMLHKVWPCMRYITVSNKKIKNTIRQYKIPVTIFMGMHDRIIPVPRAQKFVRGLETASLQVLRKGHRIFDNDTIHHIAECLLS